MTSAADNKFGAGDLMAAVRHEILSCLQYQDFQEAWNLARSFVVERGDLPIWHGWLEAVFAKEAALDRLTDALWAARHTALLDIFALGFFMRLCSKVRRYTEFQQGLNDWVEEQTRDGAALPVPTAAYLGAFHDLTAEQKIALFRTKYQGWLTDGSFWAAVNHFAERIDVPDIVAQFLFENRSKRDAQFREWLHELRICAAINHVCKDLQVMVATRRADFDAAKLVKIPNITQLVDVDAARSVFDGLKPGTLCATFHGAYSNRGGACFGHFRPDALIMRMDSGPQQVSINANRDTVGFRAFKCLVGGGVLLMAADIGAKRQFHTARVLGVDLEWPEGVPVIAYEAKSRTAFYTLIRDRERFLPVLKEGPTRKSGEKLSDFKERWWAFYTTEVETMYRGDPANISVEGNWALRLQRTYNHPVELDA